MACLPSNSPDRHMESVRKENRDEAERIYEFLSLLTSLYDKDVQRYIKSFAKHVYRWARMSSYHQIYFGQKNNDKKIEKLMAEFSSEFNKKYLPPIDNTIFYELYPSKPLLDLIKKYQKDKALSHRNTNKSDIHNLCITRVSQKQRTQKVLLLMDWDDTLIPSTMIKLKKYKITHTNTSSTERIAIDEYCKALNHLMDTLFTLFDDNEYRNMQILTNASTEWVKEDSLFNSGRLFALKMRPFAEKLSKYKVDIISALDNWKSVYKYKKVRGYNAVEPYKWKWKIMTQLFREHFGRRLDGSVDIKIISMGDSYKSEYLGAGVAFSSYLSKQNMNKTKDTAMSLHRIKFIDEPTLPQLTKQLMWCSQNIKAIVLDHDKSANYMLSQDI